MIRRWLGLALIAASAGLTNRVWAQDAQALFDQGLEDMKAGRYKIGCALLRRSLDIDARPGSVFTLAECYSRAGRYASAVELYDRYLASFEAMTPEQQAPQAARAELSRTERNRLVTLVAWLTVGLQPSAPAGVVVTRDGEPFGAELFGAATAVDPGPHVFTTRSPGGPLIEHRVDIGPGERKGVVLEVLSFDGSSRPDTERPAEPGDQPEATEVESRRSPWVYVTGALGGAGLLTGAVSGVVLLEQRKTFIAGCDRTTHTCTTRGKAALDLAQGTLAPLTTVALSLGVAGTVATVFLLLTDGPAEASGSALRPSLDLTGAEGPTLGLAGAF